MFLFTTPSNPQPAAAPPRAAGPQGAVVDAIRDGAQSSGVGFDYLLATAQRESALDPSAKAGTSTATGLFQFIEQTWLGVMKSAGPKLGLQAYADAIVARPDGSYTVADAGQRQAILDLRRDPKIAASLAGAFTQKNGEALSAALGREPTAGDLYAAHVLGAKGATTLIAAARATPDRAAALDMPEAAAANRGLFYDRTGRPRTTAELYASLSAAGAGRTAASDVTLLTQGAAVAPPAAASAYAAVGGDLRTLFQTDRRQGALSEGVAKLFQGRAAEAARPAPSYFPRSDPSLDSTVPVAAVASADPETTGAIAAAIPAGRALVDPPLPPRRPAEFAASLAAAPNASLFTNRSGP
ncbi:transglycosylase SLT domain-containing protein [Methylobacterium sp. WL30]|nr:MULTISPECIES: transglycosylase SLT domain-containing protein [unclassified Methylobacterium]MCJ2041990.1 transglycosylase SLT domain-containing protein [Methylobacterium sp. J-059]MCJ2110184.1 transglycosylase SLT domain-containing protein [Methylobacterium sp. E-025]TXN51576.1 transglycosylase SLT domain-containing protein [Methylobacterium sp. WL119]TXN69510.1 transglycosylase SLT domain-containing protein [Methylobacterium sp. WL30]